ncbi:MAG: GspE/PulE family protein [Nanoarchaeota archaeon]|nr:GspE/PulE family protein [Nanoarchaeota archaeon]
MENSQIARKGPESRDMRSVERAGRLRKEIEDALKDPAEIPIIRLVDELVEYAYVMRSSDIHIDPETDRLRVRFRIDGVMQDIFSFPKEIHSEIITRIKVLSSLRTDEHQAAQDGRFRVQVGGIGDVDVRVSIAPTYYGENCVMRILADEAYGFSLDTLGFSGVNLEKVRRGIRRPYGMILVTGPTGSGKTTTLYSVLRELNTPAVSIITIEDPIEYSIEGIDQIQVHRQTNLTFAEGLRFILRQDPDIIMVGEIRDKETANIAVNAAMTGHLLVSTLHTNDAATTLPRLMDMGVESFLIASTVIVVINQRLVRQICKDCKEEKRFTDEEYARLAKLISERVLGGKRTFYEGKGCEMCEHSGYRGRIGIHEVLEITEEIRTFIMRQANADEIKQAAIRAGMISILEDGFEKALQGITTIEEVLRVSGE